MAAIATPYATLLAKKFASQQDGGGAGLTKKEEKDFSAAESKMAALRVVVEKRVKAVRAAALLASTKAALAAAGGGDEEDLDFGLADLEVDDVDSVSLLTSFANAMKSAAAATSRIMPQGMHCWGLRDLCGGNKEEVIGSTGAVRAAGIMELPAGVLVIGKDTVVAMCAPEVAAGEKVAGAPLYEPDCVQLRLKSDPGCCTTCCVKKPNRVHKYQLTAAGSATTAWVRAATRYLLRRCLLAC
jgi:hypothetical protein